MSQRDLVWLRVSFSRLLYPGLPESLRTVSIILSCFQNRISNLRLLDGTPLDVSPEQTKAEFCHRERKIPRSYLPLEEEVQNLKVLVESMASTTEELP